MKRYVLTIMALCVLLLALPFAVPAKAAEPECTVRVDSVMAGADSDVLVTVRIENNPGIGGMELSVSYDERLTLIGAKNGDAFKAMSYTEPAYFRNPTIFVWDGEKVQDEDVVDGVILTLVFHTPDIKGGTFPVSIAYESGDVYNKDMQPIELNIADGRVTTAEFVPGDADGNGRVNSMDVTMIRRYISDGRQTDPNGYNVTIQEHAADVNADGRVNTMDITMIRQFISDGWTTDPEGYNVILKPGLMPCVHELVATEEKPATCAEEGNIAYWYCGLCNKYFSGAEAKYEILLANTVIERTDHSFATEWSMDENFHWKELTCEHADEEKTEKHTYGEDHKCTVCGAIQMLTVKFVDHDGSTVAMRIVPYGTAAEAPALAERSGYQFDGWSASTAAVTEDMTVTARYIKLHTVTFVDFDGTELKKETVRNGEAATAPENVEPPVGFESTGWDKTFDSITEDTTVMATYQKKMYTVEFYSAEGKLLDSQQVAHGETAQPPECEEQYFNWNTHEMGVFSGWGHSLEVTSDLKLTAQYNNAFDRPVLSIDTTKNSADINLYAPKGCYLYALEFGFNWEGSRAINKKPDTEISSSLYDGGNNEPTISYSNKGANKNFRYAWVCANGAELQTPEDWNSCVSTVVYISFSTQAGFDIDKDTLKLIENCLIVYSTKANPTVGELTSEAPIIMIR